jgi:glyoxylase-like metal-dependent hydrolase (beta-lactamase superfamily II)
MDLIQPGNIQRKPRDDEKRIAAYRQGKDTDGRALSEEEKQQANEVIPKLERMEGEFRALVYQSPTLTFTDILDIDIGGREVQVEHVGRGHTPGDTIVYLPTEKILVAGDLLVYPIPHIAFAGYPGEWVAALERLERFEATTIVTGHGAVLHDKTYLRLVIELLQSALSQVRARIGQLGHPAGYTVDAIRGAVDLTPFRFRFAGDDKDRQEEFDDQMKRMVELIFKEESLR